MKNSKNLISLSQIINQQQLIPIGHLSGFKVEEIEATMPHLRPQKYQEIKSYLDWRKNKASFNSFISQQPNQRNIPILLQSQNKSELFAIVHFSNQIESISNIDPLIQKTIYETIKLVQSYLAKSDLGQIHLHYTIDAPPSSISGTSGALSIFMGAIYHLLNIPNNVIPFATGSIDFRTNRFTTVSENLEQKMQLAKKMGCQKIYCIKGQKVSKKSKLKIKFLNADPLIAFFEILQELPKSYIKNIKIDSFLKAIEQILTHKRDIELEKSPIFAFFLSQKIPSYENIYARFLFGKSFLNRGKNQLGLKALKQTDEMILKLKNEKILPSEYLIKFGHIIAQNAIANLDNGYFNSNLDIYKTLKKNIFETEKLFRQHQSLEFAYLLIISKNTLARILEYQGRWHNNLTLIKQAIELRLTFESQWLNIYENCKDVKDISLEINFQFNQVIDNLFSAWLLNANLTKYNSFLDSYKNRLANSNDYFDLIAKIKFQLISRKKIDTKLENLLLSEISKTKDIFAYPIISILSLLLIYGSKETIKNIRFQCLNQKALISNEIKKDGIHSLLYCQLLEGLNKKNLLKPNKLKNLIAKHKRELLKSLNNFYIKIPY